MLHRGSNCLPSRAMDGRIMRHGIISLCQSAATSKIVKRCCSSLVSIALTSTQSFTFTFTYNYVDARSVVTTIPAGDISKGNVKIRLFPVVCTAESATSSATEMTIDTLYSEDDTLPPVDAPQAVLSGTFVISRVQIGYLQYHVYYIIVSFAKVHVF